MKLQPQNFQNLSKQHTLVVLLLAYAIKPMYYEELTNQTRKVFKSQTIDWNRVMTDLVQQGYVIQTTSRDFWQRKIFMLKNEWMYEAMYVLLTQYDAYRKKFISAFSSYCPVCDFRIIHLGIYKSIFEGVASSAQLQINEVVRLSECFTYVFTNHIEILPLLPASIQQYLIALQTKKLINDDSGDGVEKLIGNLLQLGNLKQLPQVIQHLLQLGYYMQTGQLHEAIPLEGKSHFRGIIEMLEAMNRKDQEAAILVYSSLMSDRYSKEFQWIDLFSFPLINLIYGMMAYQARGQNFTDLSNFLVVAKDMCQSPSCILAVNVFAKMLSEESMDMPIADLTELFQNAHETGWVNQKIARMLCEWQGVQPEKISPYLENKSLCDLQSISYYAHATRLASESLQSIYVKPHWERTLDLILSREEKTSSVAQQGIPKEERSKRLAYFIGEKFGAIIVKEQSWLKSQRWSTGRMVYDDNFAIMSGSHLDSIDQQIQGIVRAQRYSRRIPVNSALPCLKGSDKLYYERHGHFVGCMVVEDKPFIATQIGKESITISTNLPDAGLSDQEEDHLLISYHDNPARSVRGGEPVGVIAYFRVPVQLRQYIKALTSVGQFPLSAEPQLKRVFEQLRGKVEIHSEMIEGGSTLPQVQGNSNVIIQIIPVSSGYEVQAVVRPLEGGNQTVVPGRGDNNVYDQGTEGVRYQVVRDKKKEKQNAEALSDFMEQADVKPDKSPYVWLLDPYSLLELMEWVPEQGSNYTMEWPEGQRIKLNTPDLSTWNISLKEHAGWFDVEGELPIDEQTVLSIGKLFELMGEGRGRFVKLEDGQYVRLTESLRRQLQRIESVANNVRGKMKISPLGAGLIADYLNGDVTIAHPKKIDQLRRNIKKSEHLQVEIPSELNATLRDYQTDGVQWMNRMTSWGAGVCLADDMGLGKTVQSITFLLQHQSEGASMVVAPTSVVPNWKRELDRFAPTLNVSVLNDLTPDDRKAAIAKADTGDVILTTYGLLISEEEALVEKQWNVICLDEAHSIKNASTKTSAVCMKLQASKRLILTGTPIQNHLGELWNLFCFINPGLLGSYEQFSHKYINPIEVAHDKERQQQLRRIIQPFMLRRTKKEVVKELPEKQEITIPVGLSKEELAIYELIRMEAKAQLESDVSGNGAASVNALAMITRLRMASCAASLVQKSWDGPSSKLSTFSDLVSEICTAGNRVLVFSQFTSFLEMAKKQLESQGINDYLYLDGSTPVRQRTKMVEQFQAGHAQLFLISLKAGGLGLNLTGANYVIHLDPWWNPAIEQQATDRAYRIGQKQNVTVYHLISEHTIEEKIVRLHQTKRDLADSLLDGTDMSHKLRAKDLLDMLQTDAQ